LWAVAGACFDPAGNSLRLSRRWGFRRACRWAWFHPSGRRPGACAVDSVSFAGTADLGARRWGRSRCRSGRRRRVRRARIARPEPSPSPRGSGACDRVSGIRGGGRRCCRVDWGLSRAGATWLWSARTRSPASFVDDIRGALGSARCARARGVVRRRRGAGVDCVEGRGTLIRRRVRDHPADAGRCGAHVSLDDQQSVSKRRRAGPGHAGAGCCDRCCGRLRRSRPRRWPARRRHCVRALVLVHPARRRPL
jgi:hypothetical protein